MNLVRMLKIRLFKRQTNFGALNAASHLHRKKIFPMTPLKEMTMDVLKNKIINHANNIHQKIHAG